MLLMGHCLFQSRVDDKLFLDPNASEQMAEEGAMMVALLPTTSEVSEGCYQVLCL